MAVSNEIAVLPKLEFDVFSKIKSEIPPSGKKIDTIGLIGFKITFSWYCSNSC